MLRIILLYLSRAAWARKLLLAFPPTRRVARRFVSGETCEDVIAAVRSLNARGITASANFLGENVTTDDAARRVADEYIHLLDYIHENEVDSWISVKLTQLGLDISEELCLQNMRRILDHARERDIQVAIDMEGSAYTDRTLTVFHVLHDEEDYDNVRTVIQAYMYRSQDDVKTLIEHNTGVRLVKGAYQEPPEVAFPKKADTNANYVELMHMLLDGAADNSGYPAIATHDENMIEAARQYAEALDLSPDAYEFQMIYGVRSAMQDALAEQGYRMRVYVPYGSEWYPYFMRRLAERPANLWFFMSNLFRG
jgi:proline dehydrogenase